MKGWSQSDERDVITWREKSGSQWETVGNSGGQGGTVGVSTQVLFFSHSTHCSGDRSVYLQLA